MKKLTPLVLAAALAFAATASVAHASDPWPFPPPVTGASDPWPFPPPVTGASDPWPFPPPAEDGGHAFFDDLLEALRGLFGG